VYFLFQIVPVSAPIFPKEIPPQNDSRTILQLTTICSKTFKYASIMKFLAQIFAYLIIFLYLCAQIAYRVIRQRVSCD